jgi:hypothetical protein
MKLRLSDVIVAALLASVMYIMSVHYYRLNTKAPQRIEKHVLVATITQTVRACGRTYDEQRITIQTFNTRPACNAALNQLRSEIITGRCLLDATDGEKHGKSDLKI